MVTVVKTIKTVGLEPVPVKVECLVTPGIGIHLVGLADAAVKESLLRTVTALQAKGFYIPGRKMVINLAPADLNKQGSGYDLPIALGIIAESGQVDLPELDQWVVIGELALDGNVRAVPGCIQAVEQMRRDSNTETIKGCIIPAGNAKEVAALFESETPVYGAATLVEAIDIIRNPSGHAKAGEAADEADTGIKTPLKESCWSTITNNEYTKRALEIAAAGGHSLMLIGDPDSDKKTIARALAEILPPMTRQETLEVAKAYSISGRNIGQQKARPFRAPYHSASMAAFFGGGSGENICPGEVTLANKGVLFLDEFECMPKALLDGLRGPIEDRKVVISRLKTKVEYPADFQLVASAQPCPCGHYGEGDRCTCTAGQRLRYLQHLSGPVFDSIALQVYVHPTDGRLCPANTIPIEEVRASVDRARRIQEERFKGQAYQLNDRIPASDLDRYCHLDDTCKKFLEQIFATIGLSYKALSGILRIARTIADLEGAQEIRPHHLSEATTFRFLDRITN